MIPSLNYSRENCGLCLINEKILYAFFGFDRNISKFLTSFEKLDLNNFNDNENNNKDNNNNNNDYNNNNDNHNDSIVIIWNIQKIKKCFLIKQIIKIKVYKIKIIYNYKNYKTNIINFNKFVI